MPQSPPANADQKEILEALVGLSQTEAVSTGNQVALVEDQLKRFQHAQDIFQERYGYWDNYIQAYHAERKLLNGQFILQPVTQADFDNFIAATGRLYQSGSYTPKRIAEFDNVGFGGTGTEQENEIYILGHESRYRDFLLNGFVSSIALPGGNTFRTLNAITPTTMQIEIERTDGSPFSMSTAPNELLIYTTGSPTGGVIVEYLQVTNFGESAILKGLKFSSTSFSTIPTGSAVVDSGPVFSDAVRASQNAGAALQSRLYAYMGGYLAQVNRWHSLLTGQSDQFTAEQNAGEDQPDSDYIASVQDTLSTLQDFIATPNYADSGLTPMGSQNTTRSGQITPRAQWIDDRLIQQTKAYDSRYKYVDRLYNMADGAYPLIRKFEAQKEQLGVRQAASNYRAAQLSEEIF